MMKRFGLIAAAVSGILAAACVKEAPEDALTVNSTEISVSAAGASVPVSFASNADWTISSDKDWVSFNKASGVAGDVTVTMTVAPNDGYDARKAAVTISAGTKKTVINVSQTEVTEFGTEVVFNLDGKEQVLAYTVSSNMDYTVKVSDDAADWIVYSEVKSAPVSKNILFTVRALEPGLERTGTIMISAGDFVQKLVVNQSSAVALSLVEAKFLGNRMMIYDMETYEYPSFDEYYLKFDAADGSEVTLAVNTEDLNEGRIPVGEFSVDGSGKHVAGTFSVATIDGSESMYTSIRSGEYEKVINDGVITVTEAAGEYTIVAIFYGETGEVYSYKYNGPVATVADESFGAMLYSAEYKGTYNTHFTTKANEYSVTLCVSSAPDESSPYLRFVYFNCFAPAGEVSGNELPLGTFTFGPQEESTEVTYANGKLIAQPGTATNDGNGSDAEGNDFSFKDGSTVTIFRNEDGTYNFEFKSTVSLTGHDDDWNIVDLGEKTYNATVKNVVIGNVSESDTKPVEDGSDIVFDTFNGQGLWYGNQWGTGGNAFVISRDGTHHVDFVLNSAGDWEFEKNYANRYCSKPVPSGVYTFTTEPEAGKNALVPTTAYGSFRNGYTGTTFVVKGGTVTVTDSETILDLTFGKGDITFSVTGSYSGLSAPFFIDKSTAKLTIMK